jgi:hypothetical protein
MIPIDIVRRGGPTTGELFTLYLDGSGGFGWPGKSKKATEFFVLAGPVFRHDADLFLRFHITSLLESCFPDPSQRPSSLPHCSDVFGGQGPCRDWTEGERETLIAAVFDLVRSSNAMLMGTVVRKRPLFNRFGERAEHPLVYALRATIGRFDHQLAEWGCPGQVIADSEQAEARRVIEALRDWRLHGTKFSPSARTRFDTRLAQILNTVHFVSDEDSPGVQLADWISNVTFGYHEFGRAETYSGIQPLWRRFGFSRQEPLMLPAG